MNPPPDTSLPGKDLLIAACRGFPHRDHPILDAAGEIAMLYELRLRAKDQSTVTEIDWHRRQLMARVDLWVAGHLPVPHCAARLHTETISSVVDRMARLSVDAYAWSASDDDYEKATVTLNRLGDGYQDLAEELNAEYVVCRTLSSGGEGMVMNARTLETPSDWARLYRLLFGLPHVHVTAPGFVLLPLGDSIGAVNTPEPLGVLILGELTIRGIAGPVLVRERPPRRTFLAVVDVLPSPECLARLESQGIDIGPHRSNLVLPTGFGRHTQEGRWWARGPQRDESLPLLSEIIGVIVALLHGPRERSS